MDSDLQRGRLSDKHPSESRQAGFNPRAHIARWAPLWGTPALADRVTVTFSRRQRVALGRCLPARGIVRLNALLLQAPADLLVEVLCHEAAHVAAWERFGRCRPHGPEWQSLMRAAGYTPRVRATLAPELEALLRPARRARAYEHRCPVCQAMRLARRPVPQWRCAACLAAGRDGRIVINRTGDAPGG